MDRVALLLELYGAALAAADPRRVLSAWLPRPPKGRTVVVAVGKAASAMAQAVEQHWIGPLDGVVVVPEGAALPLQRLRLLTAAHPVADDRSVAAAHALKAAVGGLGSDDLVLALMSGGGSALCALPAPGVTLQDKQRITRALIHRGANIQQLNTVRRHLSAVKGGRLAQAAAPARVVTLLISDVPGDDPALVASGPTLPDSSTCEQALVILDHFDVEIPAPLRTSLRQGVLESPKSDNACFRGHEYHVVARAADGLRAAAAAAARQGLRSHILTDRLEGDARTCGRQHALMSLRCQAAGEPLQPPGVLLSAGETTVDVRGRGRGGRNSEFALAMALTLEGAAGIWALCAGTDGLDGSAPAAGAWIGPDTLRQVRAAGLDARAMLDDNDSFGLFDAVGSAVVTGPTFTNINDFQAVWIER